ncbi:MAG: hypothetical protein ACON3Z_10010 [Bradymonadia bacterium]
MTPEEWLNAHRSKSFGVVLPGGWVGKPGDMLFRVQSYSLTSKMFSLQGTDGLIVEVSNPRVSVGAFDGAQSLSIQIGSVRKSSFSVSGRSALKPLGKGTVKLVSLSW